MIGEFFRIMRVVGGAFVNFFRGTSKRRVIGGVVVSIAALFALFMIFTAGWERPPITGVQTGYRGSGRIVLFNPRKVKEQFQSTDFDDPPPLAEAEGQPASDVFQNLKVLDDLTVNQFVRTMQVMTQAVAPDQGCNYCHAAGNFASDDLYTKRVARQMLKMTRQINTRWEPHVANVGVTCYTCHRGNNVPAYKWGDDAKGDKEGANSNDLITSIAGYSSLPTSAFESFLKNPDDESKIRVQGKTRLPDGNIQGIQDAEHTFALMIHFSNSLGVDCAFCHNSRAFSTVEDNPRGKRALYGIRMVEDLNHNYILPLAETFPDYRKDVSGEPYKINCASCHQGVYQPLYGQEMLTKYPELGLMQRTAAASKDGGKTKRGKAKPKKKSDDNTATNAPVIDPKQKVGLQEAVPGSAEAKAG